MVSLNVDISKDVVLQVVVVQVDVVDLKLTISSLFQSHRQTNGNDDEISPVNVVILFFDSNLVFYEMFVF